VIERPFKVLDEALAEQTYLVGEDFTVADLNVAAVVSRAIEMDLSATPHLGAWLRRCLERPAALEARRLRQMSDDASPPDSIRLIARINRL
jgi:glutathione S-transferase